MNYIDYFNQLRLYRWYRGSRFIVINHCLL